MIAECSFSPDSSPLVRVPKKSLFDPGGCPFTLFREKIGRDGKRFLRNFMNFAKKYFSGIKTRGVLATHVNKSFDPGIRPKIRKRFVGRFEGKWKIPFSGHGNCSHFGHVYVTFTSCVTPEVPRGGPRGLSFNYLKPLATASPPPAPAGGTNY